jgi:hypothetical protein
MKLIFWLGCYRCIFHGTGNLAQLWQNFGISREFEPPPSVPQWYNQCILLVPSNTSYNAWYEHQTNTEWHQCCWRSNLWGWLQPCCCADGFRLTVTILQNPTQCWELLAQWHSIKSQKILIHCSPPVVENARSCIVLGLINVNYTSHLLRNNWVIRVINVQWIGMNLEGTFEASTEVLPLYLPWGTEEDHDKLNQYSVTRMRFELVACWLWVLCVATWSCLFVDWLQSEC